MNDFLAKNSSWLLDDLNASSGVRKKSKLAIAALHAAVALGYMLVCCQALLSHTNSITEKAYLTALANDYRTQLLLGLEALQPITKSDICEKILDDLKIVATS